MLLSRTIHNAKLLVGDARLTAMLKDSISLLVSDRHEGSKDHFI